MKYFAHEPEPMHPENPLQAILAKLEESHERDQALLRWLDETFEPELAQTVWTKVEASLESRKDLYDLASQTKRVWEWMFHRLFKIHHGEYVEDVDAREKLEPDVVGNIYNITKLLAHRRECLNKT